jgi:hypothetical protein
MKGTAHSNHHFIPEFLLKQWHSSLDQRLTAFAWKHGKLTASRHKGKAVAKLLGLYALHEVPPESRNMVEAQVLQIVDGRGAQVHAKIIQGEVAALTDQESQWWTRFVVSLLIRSPWKLQVHIDDSPRVLLDTLKKDPLPDDDPHARFASLMVNRPHLTRDMTVHAMVKVINSSTTHEKILGSTWGLVDLKCSPVDLVMSDQAIIRHGNFDDDYLLAFPVSPTQLLCIHPDGSKMIKLLQALPPKELVMRANRDSASQAMQYLFATSAQQEALARKYLAHPPDARQ